MGSAGTGARLVVPLVATAALLASSVLGASGATSNGGTVVTATIPSATTLDVASCAPNAPGITNFGTVQPGSLVATTSDCSVTFGSTNDSSSLRVAQSDGTGTAMGHPVDTWTTASGSSGQAVALGTAGGTSWAAMANGTMYRSLDGGQTWPVTSTPSAALTEIAVPNATSAWAVGNTSQVWRTTNATAGSPTWGATSVASGVANVRGVAALDQDTAWVVGAGGEIRSTANGGTTAWTVQASPTTSALTGINILDSDSLVTWGSAGLVVATSNGTTWRDISIPAGNTLREVAILSDTTMVAVGIGGAIYTTTNATAGSPTWTLRSSGVSGNIEDVFFTTATDGYAFGEYGVMLVTADGGATWTRRDASTSVSLLSAAAVSASTFLVAGRGNSVARSADTGATWAYTLAGNVTTWHDVSMATDRVAWRVGSDGTVARSANGGQTWTAQTSTTSLDLFGVHAFDAQNAVAVGRGGRIVATSDGGTTWTTRTSGTTEDLWSVDGVAGRYAWAVGEGGVILASNDYGQTWVVQSTSAGVSLYDVAATSQTVVNAVGRTGVAYRTTDGGTTWTTPALPSSTVTVADIDAVDGTSTVFYEANGAIYRSTNGGSSWTQMAAPGTAQLRGLAAASPTVLVAVTLGQMRLSTNAGATWSTFSSGISGYSLYGVDAIDRGHSIVVGEGNGTGYSTTANDVDDYVMNTSDWYADGTEAFGICLRSTTASTPTWTVNATCDQSADGAHWRAVPTTTGPTSEVVSNATPNGALVANFRFGLRLASNEPPGELSAGVSFVVVSPDV